MIRTVYCGALALATFSVLSAAACGNSFTIDNPGGASSASSTASSGKPDGGEDAGDAATGGSGGTGGAPSGAAGSGGGVVGCTHGLCSAGPPLSPSCAPCVPVICGKIPSCCTSAWTIACVTEYANGTCANNCRTNFADCAHSPCVTGGPLLGGPDDACSPVVYDVCVQQQMPYCCTMGWDQKCVEAATGAAGAICPPPP